MIFVRAVLTGFTFFQSRRKGLTCLQVDTRLPVGLPLPPPCPLGTTLLAPASAVRSRARTAHRAGSPPTGTGRKLDCRTARGRPAASPRLAGRPSHARKVPACSLPASALDASTGGLGACSSARRRSSWRTEGGGRARGPPTRGRSGPLCQRRPWLDHWTTVACSSTIRLQLRRPQGQSPFHRTCGTWQGLSPASSTSSQGHSSYGFLL